jgi:YesN/AraC family two-component response regulator
MMATKPKVLCVDDEMINLLILKKILGKRNFQVITAENGLQALDYLKKDSEIHLIITDMHMPYMTGLEFIKQARELYEDKHFFMLSGYAITEETQQALDTGLILDYFEKPPDFNKIVEALKQVVSA